ncbi:MAG: hypothetical protein OEZ06_20605 [Myxococcales bacterium]|nr:hypothetical protein [Myxococcales bacterium]
MNTRAYRTTTWPIGPSLALASLLAMAAACTDSPCPAGSEEVDGICQERRDSAVANVDAGRRAEDASKSEPNDGMEARDTSRIPVPDERDEDAGYEQKEAAPAEQADAAVAAPQDAGRDNVDPCAALSCGDHGSCEVVDGGAICICDAGYDGDGQSCEDIDECSGSSHDCHDDASCENTDGGFTCSCDVGYEGDGKSCNANPCEPRANPCDAATTTCRNDSGTAVCDCLPGRGRCDAAPYSCSTNLSNDADHCGSCGLACAGDLGCDGSSCELPITKLFVGAHHSCAYRPDGEVVCWGSNSSMELGRADENLAGYIPGLIAYPTPKLFSAGLAMSCAVRNNNAFTCWGNNSHGRVSPSGSGSGVFELGTNITTLDVIAPGDQSTCVLEGDAVRCWGNNASGTLALSEPTATRAFDLRATVVLPPVTSVTTGYRIACATTKAGEVHCWGSDTGFDPVVRKVTDGSDITVSNAIAVDTLYSTYCALLSSGRIMCWGSNSYGQLGNRNVGTTSSNKAVVVMDGSDNALSDAVQVAVGHEHACARRQNGTIVCWGKASLLGSGSSENTAQPGYSTVAGIDDAIDLGAGYQHTCALRSNGQVVCWGTNSAGQCGTNPAFAASHTTPANVIGLP